LDDIGVSNSFHNLNLSSDSLPVIIIFQCAFIDDFDGNILSGGGMDGCFDFSKGSTS
jgi:hypothetical protein